MGQIGIIGSINVDLTTKTNVVPVEGETVIGEELIVGFGGKGANLAVASSRLGEKTNIIACLGDDDFSKDALKNLKNEKVCTDGVIFLKNQKCGIANIILQNGQNRIIIMPGANELLEPSMLDENLEILKRCSVVGGQFEIPAKTLCYASQLCKQNGITFVLNLSPIKPYNKKILDNSTYIIVNEIEVQELPKYDSHNPNEILKLYPNKLILTKGADGVYYSDGKDIIHIPAIKAKVKDTTGAGDTFFGSFMVAINRGLGLYNALRLANICAGLKTTKIGTQTGMPTIKEVRDYIKANKIKLKI